VLTALNEGKISEAVDRFNDHFTFTDHALGLEFIDKERLTDFFQKSRELFPDPVVEAEATFESGSLPDALYPSVPLTGDAFFDGSWHA
jgi:hypothetical protein